MEHPKCRTCGKRHRYGPCPQETPKFEEMPILPDDVQRAYVDDVQKNFVEKNTGVRGGYTGGSGPKPEAPTTGSGVKSPFDRTAYQRDYMRKWRIRKRKAKGK